MKAKYALHPGYVKSQEDYVSVAQLASLYGLHPKDYIIWDDNRPETFMGRTHSDYTHLYPRFDGNYIKR